MNKTCFLLCSGNQPPADLGAQTAEVGPCRNIINVSTWQDIATEIQNKWLQCGITVTGGQVMAAALKESPGPAGNGVGDREGRVYLE